MIYLDHNATTPLDPDVFQEMTPFLTSHFGNASSVYELGRQSKDAVKQARERIAELLGCHSRCIVFTSGGTEANNAAVRSALQLTGRRHIVISAVEHPAIKTFAESLEQEGVGVTYVSVNDDGAMDVSMIESSIREDTALVSVMWANNETGVVYPIEAIGELCRKKGVLFHTDAVQAVGKLLIALEQLPIDYASFSAHKLCGPKGIGALYVNRRSGFSPLLWGGGQERGRRGGTENVPGIVGFGAAAERRKNLLLDEMDRIQAIRDKFENTLLARIPEIVIHGKRSQRLPNTSYIGFPNIEAEALLLLLDKKGICASTGSACSTGSLEPSHVLLAMGVSRNLATSSIRFSFGETNRDDQVAQVVDSVVESVEHMKSMIPG